jgi:hypothetical protein
MCLTTESVYDGDDFGITFESSTENIPSQCVDCQVAHGLIRRQRLTLPLLATRRESKLNAAAVLQAVCAVRRLSCAPSPLGVHHPSRGGYAQKVDLSFFSCSSNDWIQYTPIPQSGASVCRTEAGRSRPRTVSDNRRSAALLPQRPLRAESSIGS